jgi:hypothetical protein
VGAQVVEKIGERFGEHLFRWEIRRNLVCADRVRHEIRESNLPARTTLNPRSPRHLLGAESGEQQVNDIDPLSTDEASLFKVLTGRKSMLLSPRG